MKPKTNAPIHGLTTIRAFVALQVVAFHAWSCFLPLEQNSWFYHHVINVGYVGVNFFFILSGYILSYVYIGDVKEPAVEKSGFWKSRFARIYPVYVFSFALEIPLFVEGVISRHDHLKNAFMGTATLFANLLFIQAWFPDLRWRWNNPSWTLSVEAFFYLLFPILGVWIWKKARNENLPLIIFAVYLILLAPSIFFWITRPGSNEPMIEWMTLNPALRIPEFVLGILLFKYQRHYLDSSGNKKRLSRLFTWLGLSMLMVGLMASGLIPWFVLRGGILDPAFMSLIAGVALAERNSSALWNVRPLVLLGEASYSVYILQAPIKEWFSMVTPRFQIYLSARGDEKNHPVLFLVYLSILIGAGILSLKYFETPLRRKINNSEFKFFS